MRIIRRQHYVAHAVFFRFAVTLAQPLLQMFARRRTQFREKQSRPSLIAGPHHIRVAVQSNVRPRQHAPECEV